MRTEKHGVIVLLFDAHIRRTRLAEETLWPPSFNYVFYLVVGRLCIRISFSCSIQFFLYRWLYVMTGLNAVVSTSQGERKNWKDRYRPRGHDSADEKYCDICKCSCVGLQVGRTSAWSSLV